MSDPHSPTQGPSELDKLKSILSYAQDGQPPPAAEDKISVPSPQSGNGVAKETIQRVLEEIDQLPGEALLWETAAERVRALYPPSFFAEGAPGGEKVLDSEHCQRLGRFLSGLKGQGKPSVPEK